MADSPDQIETGQRVVVISGPSGSGKTTIVERLMADPPVPLRKCVSATTRPPRPGEIDGVSYYFLTDHEFRRRLENGEFIEYAEVFRSGNLYGTLRSEVRKAADAGAWAFLEIDVNGALQVMQQFPDAITMFVRTPSDGEFERRLRARGTESEDVIQRRLETAREELRYVDRYRYQIVNDEIDSAVQQVAEILQSEMRHSHA